MTQPLLVPVSDEERDEMSRSLVKKLARLREVQQERKDTVAAMREQEKKLAKEIDGLVSTLRSAGKA